MHSQYDAEDKKIVVLIGNGLGRAFHNEGFAIEHLLKRISSELSIPAKAFFAKIFQSGFPENEEELGILEELNDAFDIIDKLPFRTFLCDSKSETDVYIDESFKKDFVDSFFELKTALLQSIQKSSFQVIEDKRKNGYEKFSSKLLSFIDNCRPTIGTLNYDNLLFKILCMKYDELLRKNDGYTDGFFTENEEEQTSKRLPTFINDFFSWASQARRRPTYLHLHGAYFYTLGNEIEKQSTTDYTPSIENSHLVILTSQKKKIQYVYDSPQDFFRTYSGYFFEKLLDAEHIIIFGYGGRDEYLNTNLRYATNKAKATSKPIKITIICRDEEIPDNELREKWLEILTGTKNNSDWATIVEKSARNTPLSKQAEGTCKIRKFSNLKEFEWLYENNSKET